MPPTIAIIGAGIAGLSAGCYAQMNGYQAHIFELHDLPGGVVTAWKRRGYLFDGCIEFLNGSSPSARWNRLWQELGAAQGRPFVYHSETLRVRSADGRELVQYADIDRLEAHLLALSPADSPAIRAMAADLRALAAFDPPLDVRPLEMLGEMPRMLRWMRAFNRLNKVSITQYTARFEDPFLRQALACGFPPALPAGMALNSFAFQHGRQAGCPMGGSLAFARAIAARFCELGGQIHYRARVEKILVEPHADGANSRAVGLRLANGEEHRADWVISAADGHAAIYQLLEGR